METKLKNNYGTFKIEFEGDEEFLNKNFDEISTNLVEDIKEKKSCIGKVNVNGVEVNYNLRTIKGEEQYEK